jgi:hypothetical protein
VRFDKKPKKLRVRNWGFSTPGFSYIRVVSKVSKTASSKHEFGPNSSLVILLYFMIKH